MTKADELNALADRCEREEPSAELQQGIGLALGWTWKMGVSRRWFKPTGGEAHLPDWLHSLDAAVTLVPESRSGCDSWCLDMDNVAEEPRSEARISLDSCKHLFMAVARTPAAALCAAALRAKAALSHPEPAPMRSERSERVTSLLPAKEGK